MIAVIEVILLGSGDNGTSVGIRSQEGSIHNSFST